jgi:peroxiredoxin-like protein
MPTSDERHEYQVKLTRTRNRVASLEASGISEKIEVATPPEFPGGVEGIWSPEHLFTASVVSCFFTSFEAIAEYSKFDYVDLQVESTGVLDKVDGKFVMDKVLLKPVLTVQDESARKKGIRLLEKAEQICLITRSVKTDVHLTPTVVLSEADS